MATRRIATIAVSVAMLVGLLALPALAAQVNGLGKTHRHATLGFVAKSNLSGHLRYISANHRFSAVCTKYTFFRRFRGRHGVWKVRIRATCHRQNGKRVFLRASFVDVTEPGVRDRARILWGRRRHLTWTTAFIRDRGRISNGNIQVH